MVKNISLSNTSQQKIKFKGSQFFVRSWTLEVNRIVMGTRACFISWEDFVDQKTVIPQTVFMITVCHSSCGKVMSSQVSVCPQGEGVHPLGRHPQADTP